MNQKKFIITMDKAVADELSKQGYQLVSTANNTFTFINSEHVVFSEQLKNKVSYTDMLCI